MKKIQHKTFATVAASLMSLMLAGCNTLAFLEANDPFEIKSIYSTPRGAFKGPRGYNVSVVSLSSERRAMVIKNDGKFCAEPPPDVALSVTDRLEALLKGKIEDEGKATAKLLDEYQTAVTKLADRTELLDVYRSGVYAICQYHLNGAIDGQQLVDMFGAFTQDITDALIRGKSAGILDRPSK